MDKIAQLEIRKTEKLLCFKVADSLQLKKGDYCIVEFTQGTRDSGRILKFLDTRNFLKITVAGKVLRKVTSEDMLIIQENIGKKNEAFKICREKITEHNLPIKLINVEYSFDKTKIIFYYWAEERIDFRKLVKDLANIFTCRIEMKQIGLRDEAKIKGGCGICGRTLCCAEFLKKFESITMRMVKNQRLPLDMNKITGLCGRLLCCIGYEEQFYKDKKKEKVVKK